MRRFAGSGEPIAAGCAVLATHKASLCLASDDKRPAISSMLVVLQKCNRSQKPTRRQKPVYACLAPAGRRALCDDTSRPRVLEQQRNAAEGWRLASLSKMGRGSSRDLPIVLGASRPPGRATLESATQSDMSRKGRRAAACGTMSASGDVGPSTCRRTVAWQRSAFASGDSGEPPYPPTATWR